MPSPRIENAILGGGRVFLGAICDTAPIHRHLGWDAKAYARLASVEEKRGDFKKTIANLEDSLLEVRGPKIKSRMKQMKKKMNAKAKKDLLNPEDALEYKNKGTETGRNHLLVRAIFFFWGS